MKQQLMAYMEVVGMVAGMLTTFSFVPQVVKTWQTRSAKDVSLAMLVVLGLGVSLWIVYGWFTRTLPIIAANTATLVLIIVILILKFKFR